MFHPRFQARNLAVRAIEKQLGTRLTDEPVMWLFNCNLTSPAKPAADAGRLRWRRAGDCADSSRTAAPGRVAWLIPCWPGADRSERVTQILRAMHEGHAPSALGSDGCPNRYPLTAPALANSR